MNHEPEHREAENSETESELVEVDEPVFDEADIDEPDVIARLERIVEHQREVIEDYQKELKEANDHISFLEQLVDRNAEHHSLIMRETEIALTQSQTFALTVQLRAAAAESALALKSFQNSNKRART